MTSSADKNQTRTQLPYDLLIINGQCLIKPKGQPHKIETTNIGIRDGKIQSIGLAASSPAKETLDAKNLFILPGVIDSQVHFREPGLEHKEDLYHGTTSAVAGGVTTIFEMPNTNPNTSSRERFEEKIHLAESKAKSNFAFFIGATEYNIDQLPQLEQLPGCSGVKIFMGSSTGDLLVADDSNLEKIFATGRRRIAVHCEDEAILLERKHLAEEGAHPKFHPVWRNVRSALQATQRIVRIARKYKRPLHVLHISTADEIAFLKENKDVASVECLPQYLTLSAPECYERLGSLAQMNPPVREQHHQDALWKAIETGIIDVLGSDHAPHTREEKAKPYPQSPSGMPGVQTLLPIMLNHVSHGRLNLERLTELVSYNPARLYEATQKGEIAVGKDADLTLVDMNQEKMISNSWIQSKCGWTPYDGMTVKGWPKATIVNGQFAMREDQLFANVIGRKVLFE